ncbi:dynactin subunit 3 [Lingula anatina]|uniref:Dynactin subunit 3 n=1 Tax=Lingula anatina TaxID=7574 RepID=A0A1S3K9M8_LINAN|nr:dynactin subunit 3 [Lingula anatina]|eukprot:XP_013419149.1 dynactin subunit 3 [Lingula anatina]
MEAKSLDLMESRLDLLENLIFGNADKDATYPKCVEALSEHHNKLSSATDGKTKVSQVLKRLSEIESYLDPKTADELALTDEAKANILLAEEENIKKLAKDLEEIHKSTDVFESEHIKAAPSLAGKLHLLSQVQIEQQDKTCELSEETKKLLQSYNSIVALISRQFVKWDEMLTQAERAAAK